MRGLFSDYRARGGTLIVVSHDLTRLQELCADGLWLHEGKLLEHGPIEATINAYRQFIMQGIKAAEA
jgi:ABC-type polysaccharide/polyol phosphate transport system ATPase subunit